MTSGGGGPPEERHNHSKGLPMSTHPAYCLIPLTSSEPLWEWDIVSDALFLSLGACSRLRLPEPPTRMADFLGYIPPHALPRLNELREGVLSGTAGSCLECDYPFNNQWIQEHLLVLARNEKGRASKIMGRFTITPALAGDPAVEAKARQSGLPEVGIWIYSVPSRNVWRDSICAALLGETASGTYSVSYDNRTTAIHPADRKSLLRRYRLFIEQKFLGESIDDIIRVRLNNGQYARMLVRGSVLERDHTGRATLLAGTLQREESLRPGTLRSSDDERLHYALDTVGDGLWDWDLRTNAVYYSPRCLAMLGYEPEQFPAHVDAWKDRIHPDDHDKIVDTQLAVIQSPRYGDSFECTYRMRRADGGWAWLFGRGCVTRRDDNGRACHLVNIVTNITTAQTERDRLEELVKNDALTGLRSRAYCNLEAERIEKNGIRPVCVISCDITGLKMVNDNLGHAAGDELLAEAATLLRKPLRLTDCVARMGGDEFVVLLPGCAPDKGRELLRKIEACFAERNRHPGRMPILAAFGLACSENPEMTLARVMVQADTAMLRQKRAQRKIAHKEIKNWIEARTGHNIRADDRLPVN